MKRILWIENNLAWPAPYVFALGKRGFIAEGADTLTLAEDLLNRIRYDLVIINVSMPTTAGEEKFYPPAVTDRGRKSGLVLYRRHKEKLAQQKTKVMVLTVRMDTLIQEEFIAEGLPPANFNTKLDLREVSDFAAKVEEIMAA